MAVYLEGFCRPLRPGNARVLHVAPEEPIMRVLDRVGMGAYISVDLEPGAADVTADVTDLPMGDASFDLVICSHVLEHVPDDRAALGEFRRVLADGGEILLHTPVSSLLEATIEDPGASPEQRAEWFGQDDHVRIYGPDFVDRIAAAGLSAERFDASRLGTELRDSAGLDSVADEHGLRNELYVCSRPA
jgi:SAM-dependent methyltransferase